MIELRIEPRVVKSWEEFLRDAPPFSVALDGYVRGRPRFDPGGPHVNFNHHEDVDRLSTRSTCGQVFVALKQGLLDTFSQDSEPKAEVWVNDCDQDTCVALWLLQNSERVAGLKSEPLVNRLVGMADLLDTTAGAYPMDPGAAILRELNWVFDPYWQARLSGRLAVMDEPEMRNVMVAVTTRITAYSLGQGQKLELDTAYAKLGGGPGWAMIEETGPHGRSALFAQGVRAFAAVRQRDEQSWVVSLGKMSPFVSFPILELYDHLNEAEGIAADDPDRWGGGDTIGGSPREAGCRLSPERLAEVINACLEGGGAPGASATTGD
jgi:hypothetical protein